MVDDLLATLAFLLLVAGWTRRRNRRAHVPLVLAGIGLDLGLVVWLELTRSVVEKVAGTVEHAPFASLRWLHIATSTIAVLLYVPTLWYGFRLLRGPDNPFVRRRHKIVASAALLFRTVGFACMWGVEAAGP